MNHMKIGDNAPEIFRVLGKRKPEFVKPYLDELHHIAEADTNRVVRIHSLGAIRATNGNLSKCNKCYRITQKTICGKKFYT